MGLLIDLQPAAGHALVIGGGEIATRKVLTLAEAEFQVTVVAPTISERIRVAPFVMLKERSYEPEDLTSRPWALVFACTNDRAVNRGIGLEARRLRIPVVVADARDESTFFNPAVIRDGDLQVAVSTGGASPGLARRIREHIVTALAPRWSNLVYQARFEREQRDKRRAEAMERDA
jgi:siroheme synthase-like protein